MAVIASEANQSGQRCLPVEIASSPAAPGKKQGGFTNAVKSGVVPLTQLRVKLGFASPTLRYPLPHWAPIGGEGRVRGLLAQRGQFHPEGSAARPVWNSQSQLLAEMSRRLDLIFSDLRDHMFDQF
jgi:hypothetical protein